MWKVVLSTVAISSIAGNGGDATLAQVNGLAGIGRSPIGDRFLSDLGNARIRKVIADAPPPPRPLPPPLDGTISLTASQSTLDALTTFTGSISLVNAAGYTSLSLPNLTGVTADFTGNRVTIDPIAAYHFTFGTTTLNADATLVSDPATDLAAPHRFIRSSIGPAAPRRSTSAWRAPIVAALHSIRFQWSGWTGAACRLRLSISRPVDRMGAAISNRAAMNSGQLNRAGSMSCSARFPSGATRMASAMKTYSASAMPAPPASRTFQLREGPSPARSHWLSSVP